MFDQLLYKYEHWNSEQHRKQQPSVIEVFLMHPQSQTCFTVQYWSLWRVHVWHRSLHPETVDADGVLSPRVSRAVWMRSRGWGWRLWASSTPPSSSPPCSCLPSWSKIWAVSGPLLLGWSATSPTRLETSTPDGNQSRRSVKSAGGS